MTPRRRILPIFVPHAGCPNYCVFCNQKRISGSLHPASADTVRDALSALAEGEQVELAFYGGSFTAIPIPYQEELLSAARVFRERGTVTSIRLSTRPDAIDEERLALLRRYGVETVELGAQSMDDAVLKASRRGHTAEDVCSAAEMIHAAGLALILQMMTGLPESTPESDIRTAREIIALRPEGVRIYPTVIVRDTELAELWERGAYREHTVEDAAAVCARILPMMEAAGIPVIRLGLNPTEELSGGDALGGAYHPAFGELVRSRIWLDMARALLSSESHGDEVILGVPKRCVSAMTGQHRCNINTLLHEFELKKVIVRGLAGPDNGIILL